MDTEPSEFGPRSFARRFPVTGLQDPEPAAEVLAAGIDPGDP